MARDKKDTTKDFIYENENAKVNPFWFQVMVHGKRVTKRGFRTRGEAKKARAALLTELSKGDYIEPSRMTYGAYFKLWLDARRNISESTRDMYWSYFRTHIDDEIGDIPLHRLSALHIESLVNSCRDKGLADETVKRVFSTVNASLNAAEKKDIISKNVANKIEKPTVKRVERPIWKTETIQQFFKDSKGASRYWVAAYIAVMTGMRQGEILGLKWSDIDLKQGLIQVRRNLLKNKGKFDNLKTDKSRRVIAISDQIIKVLEEQKNLNAIEKEQLGDEYQDNDIVVSSSKGTPATATKVIVAWNTMQKKYKPDDEPTITFHDLRHTHASLLLQQGVHPKVVSERLGHSTITITLDTYSHLMPNMQADAARDLDKLISMD
ncbi:MAG: tyrosine-type recombinase/integrase [Candidatus Cohnella colombiensis]|uniref:Tyrosine-type recombinase/integrase n=1 Tax=Candidatus Cohnella colombiensis TaxID=3121368 RepID=A0AA95EV61_9BACL|nr:MAG: tyrosine-type recombinase/integrase [Cohnella sp.]